MAKRTARIPVIDMQNTTHARKTRLLGEGLERTGFCIITNHGISPADLRKAYAVARRTFKLPDAVKKKYEVASDGRNTGFASFQVEHAKDDPIGDLKEFWHVRKHVKPENLRFPEEIPNFGDITVGLYDKLFVVATQLLGHLDEHLGLPGTLAEMVQGGDSLLRLLYYPRLRGHEEGIRSAAHEDINLITLLVSATGAGLEIQTKSGQWMAVNNPPDAIIVNAGDMLQAFTNGRYRSTTHRVVNAEGKVRYSIPFFVHPRPEVVLVESPRLTANEYLLQRLREIGLLK